MVGRTWLRATIASVIVVAMLTLSPTIAEAAVFVFPVPDFPTTTTVGDSFTGSIVVPNNSFGVEATQPVTVQSLTLAPACVQSNSGPNCAGGIEAGVFGLGPSGTGSGAFAGIPFSIIQTSPGLYTFTPSAPLVLNVGQLGQVLFQVTTMRAPTVDVNPATPGLQTNALATAVVTSPFSAQPFVGTGSDMVTVNRLFPILSTQASTNSPNVAPGSLVTDTATVISPSGVAPAPTGTVTYTLVGPLPNGAACTSPVVGSSTVPVGSPSAPFTVTAPGAYNFLATYSGDANYNAVGPVGCNDPAERFSVRARKTVADFDGSGTTDRSVYRDGAWYVQNQPTVFHGLAGYIPVPADYDGSGDTERAVYRDGGWYVEGQPTVFFGLVGDIPVPADYDGDGDADRAVFRPSVGGWYVEGQAPVFLGQNGDIPVPGDYDGSGDAERAVYRNGIWYVEGQAPVFLGLADYIPVPGDYDGNGTTDRAVYHDGGWYVHNQATVFFGLAGYVPEPGDYDGNGTTDRAVYKDGAWYVQNQATVFFGLAGDIPLPLPHAIRSRIP